MNCGNLEEIWSRICGLDPNGDEICRRKHEKEEILSIDAGVTKEL